MKPDFHFSYPFSSAVEGGLDAPSRLSSALRRGGTAIDSCAALHVLQFVAREVELHGSLLEKRGFPREINGFRNATWKSNDVGKHFSILLGVATMNDATLEFLLDPIAACDKPAMRELVRNGVRPDSGLLYRLRNLPRYAECFDSILHELSKQVKHKFPPKNRKPSSRNAS
jgi:hypothetical protein